MSQSTQNTCVVCRQDKVLLTIAQQIFGHDLVVDAFVVTWDDLRTRTSADIDSDLCRQAFHTIDDEICLDSRVIRLVFCNGRHVEFSCSEWGDIKTGGATMRHG